MPTLRELRALKRPAQAVLSILIAATLAACSHDPGKLEPAPSTAKRNLPATPALLTKAPPVPHLDADCHFPWFRVPGCRGKDTAAMLRLTVSDDLELRDRLGAVPRWYATVRKSYGGQ
ncbi:hypothetical protein CI41S_40180 [Bradyrhizobium ivorense]|nr:hypothetical protein CI41S_40180 [Bradyrhizobium ivorense]